MTFSLTHFFTYSNTHSLTHSFQRVMSRHDLTKTKTMTMAKAFRVHPQMSKNHLATCYPSWKFMTFLQLRIRVLTFIVNLRLRATLVLDSSRNSCNFCRFLHRLSYTPCLQSIYISKTKPVVSETSATRSSLSVPTLLCS